MTSPFRPLDHGELNLPLAKRMGNIDTQLDCYKADRAAIADAENKEIARKAREQKARIAELLAMLPDARVLELAKPFGSRKAATARTALARAARSNRPRWLATLERECGA